jgi:diguanylate cyclase (GGDEF)-like protein
VSVLLVAHPSDAMRRKLRDRLERDRYEVQEAADAPTMMAMALASRPDAIVLDPELTNALSLLRADFRTSLVPIVFLSQLPPAEDAVGGADDYVLPPFDPDEVAARVAVTLHRSAALRGLNPLTGLPGNTVVAEEIGRRLKSREPFACLYADLDQFKAYNDRYGFSRGDDVIRALARCVVSSLEANNPTRCFAAHIGGDDFVVLTPPEEAESVARMLADRFATEVYKLYEPAVRRRGWIEVTDRRGRPARVPLCSVSIGIVQSDRGFESAAEMAEAAAEVKAVAKREPGSTWATDRRTNAQGGRNGST